MTPLALAPEAAPAAHDLSPWGMFLAADVVVQGVMIGLVAASILVWTIALVKGLELAGASARARRALRLLDDATSLEEAQRAFAGRGGVPAALVRALGEEWRESEALGPRRDPAGVRERLAIRFARIEKAAARRLSAGTGLLAITASAAPFVGLFGTVWGIMNSFIGIAEAQTTNLAIVAPGIAEALLATGIGLVAAIPAAILYNLFARGLAGYRGGLGDVSARLARLASRELDAARAAETPRLRFAAE
ncbi:tonB-system energizer ExbB [Salinarimonas ramus]|uniref:Biopolymer transport protein ExbB n=1 Tax=Salinarimonas ramus TaxID=690164 RepID=A0A917Q8E0_9HYPH|nr:tonB-system energizer ExbB [Salinarimonas ramus]GGK35192.1 tonB-system energizer ExbB [Salinarimonas ramus]